VGVVFADGAGEHGVAGFEGIEDGADCDGWRDSEGEFAVDAREGAKVVGELDANGCGIGHEESLCVSLETFVLSQV
jgi:hypothetical protein